MGGKLRSNLFGVSVLVISSLAGPAFAQNAENEASAEVDDIVVTARRREESAQDVPASITVLSGAALEQRNISDLQQVGAAVPGLSLSESGTNANGAAVYIRGVGQSAPRVTLDSGVGIYVDGIYRQSLNGGFMSLLEVDRIEVLRGPQGTLYGRNTIGGAIKIETRRPSLTEFGARMSGTVGAFDRLDGMAAVSVPLIEDRLGFRVGIAGQSADGYIERVDGQATGDEADVALQAQLFWAPSNNFDVSLNFDHATADDLGLAKFAVAVNPAATNTTFYNNAVTNGIIPGPHYTSASVIMDDPRRTNETSPYARVDFEETGVSLVASLDLGETTVRSFTSVRENEQIDGFDSDGSALEVVANDRRFSNRQVSQEFQINRDFWDGRVQFVGGVYYLESEDSQLAFQVVAPAVADAGGTDRTTGTGADQVLRSYALYGETRWALTEEFAASLGVRVSRDEKDVTGTNIRTARTNPIVSTQSASDAWESISPRLLLEYSPNASQLFYASITKGFKSGGINDTVNTGNPRPPLSSFDPEELWACEIGSKSQLWGGRGILNLSVFYSDYSNLQVRLVDYTPLGIVRQFVNAGAAETLGAELEFQARLDEHWRVNLSAQYLDSAFVGDVFDASNELIFRDGDVLDRSPSWSYSVGAEYLTDPIIGDVRLRGRVDYNWRDEQLFDQAGGASRLGSEAYGLLNASVSLEWDSVTLTAYGTNIGDEHYVTGAYDALSANGAQFFFLGRPEEWGLRLSARY